MPSRSPNWGPLLRLAPERIDEFMWMYEFELEDGTAVQAYKHRWTRRYLWLDDRGRAFLPTSRGNYAEFDPVAGLAAAASDDPLGSASASIVRHNYWGAELPVSFARSATKHRISRERSRYVVENSRIHFRLEQGEIGRDTRLLFLGEDQGGVRLEVIAVAADRGLRVIHAMRVRGRFAGHYEEVIRWSSS